MRAIKGGAGNEPWLLLAWAFICRERQHAINWLTIFVPRLSLGLILAFMVYGLFWAAGSILLRLHRVALSAQPTWRFITSTAR
jgi:hypothetical protein